MPPPAARSVALFLLLYYHEKRGWPGGYEPADCAGRREGTEDVQHCGSDSPTDLERTGMCPLVTKDTDKNCV